MTRFTRFKLTLTILSTFIALNAHAEYPDRPITLIVGYPPGGAADLTARLFAESLGKQLKQTVVVENRPGAGGTMSTSALARAKPDGYTLGIINANAFGPDQYLYRVKYKPEDLTPISQLASSVLILVVNKDVTANNAGELKALIQKDPKSFSFSSSGIGGPSHISGLLFEDAIERKVLHIPFKGGAGSMTAVVSGEIKYSFGTAAAALPLGRAGRYKMLGVTSREKSAIAPDLPTLNESGLPGFDYELWFGLAAPKGVPEKLVDKIFQATKVALKDKQMNEKLLKEGNIVRSSDSRAAFNDFAYKKAAETLKRLHSSENLRK